MLKTAIAAAITQAGWAAEVEATPTPIDVGGWRADVLAVDPASSRRIAFEAQLAAMTPDEGQQRTDRYARDAIETIWITVNNAHWLWRLPSCRVKHADDTATNELLAVAGLAKLNSADHWYIPTDVPLTRLVHGLLAHRVSTYTIEHLGPDWISDALALVPTSHISRAEQRQKRDDLQWEREQALEQRRENQRQANAEALGRRQRKLLPAVVKDAKADAGPKVRIETDWSDLPGDPDHAWGVAVWIHAWQTRRLFAVVCPVASRIDDALGSRWRNEGVRVYAASTREAERISAAMHLPIDQIYSEYGLGAHAHQTADLLQRLRQRSAVNPSGVA